MIILDPSKIRDEKKITEQQTQRRILALQHEEAEANKRTNIARENEKREKTRIATEANRGVPELIARKATLENEVKVLEARKTKALQPMEATLEQAQAQLAENIRQGELIKVKLAQLDRDQEQLLERVDAQNDTESDLKQQQAVLDRKKQALEAAEAIHAHAVANLGDKILEFHKMVAAKNIEIASRQTAVKLEADATKVRQEYQDKREQELNEKQRGVEDGYRTLAAARKEILGRDT